MVRECTGYRLEELGNQLELHTQSLLFTIILQVVQLYVYTEVSSPSYYLCLACFSTVTVTYVVMFKFDFNMLILI